LKDAIEQIEPWLRNLIREEINRAINLPKESASALSQTAETKSVMSIKEVSIFLGISQGTIHRLIRDGRIGHYRVGRRILFSLDDHIRPFLETSK